MSPPESPISSPEKSPTFYRQFYQQSKQRSQHARFGDRLKPKSLWSSKPRQLSDEGSKPSTSCPPPRQTTSDSSKHVIFGDYNIQKKSLRPLPTAASVTNEALCQPLHEWESWSPSPSTETYYQSPTESDTSPRSPTPPLLPKITSRSTMSTSSETWKHTMPGYPYLKPSTYNLESWESPSNSPDWLPTPTKSVCPPSPPFIPTTSSEGFKHSINTLSVAEKGTSVNPICCESDASSDLETMQPYPSCEELHGDDELDQNTGFLKSKGGLSLTNDIFDGLQPERRDSIPSDIDGLKYYIVPIDQRSKFLNTKDSRPWGKKKESKTKSFKKNSRFISDCKGYVQCDNVACDFFNEYNIQNKVNHTKTSASTFVCNICNHEMKHASCSARKIIEFMFSENEVHVKHFGNHNCPLKKSSIRSKEVVKRCASAFQDNVSTKPARFLSNLVGNEIVGSTKSWEEIEKLAAGTLDRIHVKNMKSGITGKLHPHGQSFPAVKKFKEKTDTSDPFLVYRIGEDYVFKTSTLKLDFCKKLDKDGDHYLGKHFVFFDGKGDRARGFTSLFASIYHPLLRKMVCLATMECTAEDTDNITLFWQILNEAIQEKFGPDVVFNPLGLVIDEASPNWQAVENIFGKDLVERSKSCFFHYMQSVKRQAAKISDADIQEIFKVIAKDWIECATIPAYEAVQGSIENLGYASLTSWSKWWHKRRAHWAQAFCPSFWAPATNLAEVYNAKLRNSLSVNLTLVAAAVDDTVDSVILQQLHKSVGDNINVSGSRGPTASDVTKRQLQRQERHGLKAADEISQWVGQNNNIITNVGEKRKKGLEDYSFEESSFEPKPPKKKSCTNAVDLHYAPPVQAEKKAESTLGFRPAIYRPERNKEFLNSLKFAKSAKYHLLNSTLSEDKAVFQIGKVSGDSLNVTLKQVPTCTCTYKVKNPRKVCMHMIFILLKCVKLPETSMVLQQIAYTETELQDMLSKFSNKGSGSISAAPMMTTTGKSRPTPDKPQVWILKKKMKQPGKTPMCAGCRRVPIEEGMVHMLVDCNITLDNGIIKPAKYYFCPKQQCLQKTPWRSDLRAFHFAYISPMAGIADATIASISNSGIDLRLKITM